MKTASEIITSPAWAWPWMRWVKFTGDPIIPYFSPFQGADIPYHYLTGMETDAYM